MGREWELMRHWEWKWEGMGITLYGNGNDPYSHGNKLPSADAVFSLCNSKVFILTFIIYYDNSAFDDNYAPVYGNC